ncbi:MAG: hypothetical protein ACRENQ_15375, partial [Gemmatimonadaceae bacterium]
MRWPTAWRGPGSRACAGSRSPWASRPCTSGNGRDPPFHSTPHLVTLDSLSAFVAALDRAGELVRITQPVSVDRELCEIADRAMKQPNGGPALLFERPILM